MINSIKIFYQVLPLFLFFQISFSQNSDEGKLMIDGEKAFLENNFLLAKEIYSQAIKLNEKNKDFWFNLAVSELKLGENEIACEHFYQAFLLNDSEAKNVIKENCPNFRDGTIVSIADVDEKPKFIYNNKEYLLFEKNEISPKYLSYLIREFKKSRIVSEKAIGRKIYVELEVSKTDALKVKVLNITGDKKDVDILEKETLSIFYKKFSYVEAKKKGENVDLWEKWALPLSF